LKYFIIPWLWIRQNHQAIGALGAIAAILTVLISLISFTKSAKQFSEQLYEQRRATTIATVSDFISTIGDSLIHNDQIKDMDRFDRLIVTRAELLLGSLSYPTLTNQIIYFLGSNDKGYLFDSTRLFNASPFISLNNINLSGTKIRDIEIETPELFCSTIKKAYFSNVTLKQPIFHYSDLSESNIINTTFENAQFYWANLANMSIELTVKKSYKGEDKVQDVFKNAEILFTNLKGLTITKVKNSNYNKTDNSSNKSDKQKNDQLLASILSKAKSLYGSQLDDDIINLLRSEYPQRFEELNSMSEITSYKSNNKSYENENDSEKKQLLKSELQNTARRYNFEKKLANTDWLNGWKNKQNVRCLP